jgi:hypothetical protein
MTPGVPLAPLLAAAGSAAGTDRFVQVAVTAGLVAMALTAALGLQIMWLRYAKLRRDRRAARCLTTWRPILYAAALGEGPATPPLAAADESTFLLLWNQLQDGLRGPSRSGLNAVARAVDARAMALRRLARGSTLDRLLALRTLGYLGQAEDFARLLGFLDERRLPLCLAAARALVHVDPARGTDLLWARLRERPDWPVAQVAAVLRDADPARLASRFIDTAPALSPQELQRLLPLLTLLDDASADVVVSNLLAGSDDPESLAGALKHVRSPSLLLHVVHLSRHPAWPVRVQAAAALGRMGSRGERDLLVRLLGDPQWWVRYRAAQSLLGGRFGGREELAALGESLPDRFARDIVSHVLAEGAA